jgi:large subunit ribosomal protein L35
MGRSATFERRGRRETGLRRPADFSITPHSEPPGSTTGMPWRLAKAHENPDLGAAGFAGPVPLESQMPKMKTKSGAKKRFKVTATGKVVAGQAGKRHGMIKRTSKFIQHARRTGVLSDPDAIIIKKNFLPYAR